MAEPSRDPSSSSPPSRGLASIKVPLFAVLGVATFIAVILGIWSWGQSKRAALERDLPPPAPIDNSAAVEAAFAARIPPVPQLVGGAVTGATGGLSTPRRPGEPFDPTAGSTP